MANPAGSFAHKLNRLFTEARKPDGSKYTQREVVQGTRGFISRVYLWKLRTGRASNPGFQVVRALADFFKVAPSYFFGEGEEAVGPSGEAVRNHLVDQIALRSSKLDQEGKKTVLNMIEYILRSQEPGEGGEEEG